MCPNPINQVSSRKDREQPRLIIVSAPSGAGKTTLCAMLLKDFPQVSLSISATTRPRRPHEQNEVHYHFLTEEIFQQRIDKEEFAEWAYVHNYRYGTLKKTIEENLRQKKHSLFDIDVQGAMSLATLHPTRALLIFILPPSILELQKRLIQRQGDSEQAIRLRLHNAQKELLWKEKFQYQIPNENLETAYKQLKEIILQECSWENQ